MRLITLLACLMTTAWTTTLVQAQTWAPADPKGAVTPPPPAREFRAAWVATVANIDWPSRRDLSVAEQKDELRRILDAAAALNLNAIILQVRPACDAIFPSKLEPWSEFLTGESGKPPTPLYDPLQEWIDGAHARGIELHAWINPFRARHFESKKPDAANHISKARPDLVRTYGQYLWLDPGEPEARAHTFAVITDLLRRYDLDGVHIDDYFYPYPEKNLPFPDDRAWNAFAADPQSPKLSRDDWRRRNIDEFVRDLYALVRRERPAARVGISPFGIWRPGYPPEVRGFDAFASLYADARKWTREGWLDYVAPQLYWKAEAPQQPFQRLLHWWMDQNDQGRHVWPGLFTSRILAVEAHGAAEAKDRKGRESWEPADITRQIGLTRASSAGGVIHFSMIALMQNRRGIADTLRAGPYAQPALTPATPWLAGGRPLPAAPGLRVSGGESVMIEWTAPAKDAGRWTLVSTRLGEQWSHRVQTAASGSLMVSEPGVDAVAVAGLDELSRLGPATVWVRR